MSYQQAGHIAPHVFSVGDKVAYSAKFCRSIGAHAGDIPFMRGDVIGLIPMGDRQLVRVRWSDGDELNVLSPNLAIVGPNLRFCDALV